jgi:hypothetical protein
MAEELKLAIRATFERDGLRTRSPVSASPADRGRAPAPRHVAESRSVLDSWELVGAAERLSDTRWRSSG